MASAEGKEVGEGFENPMEKHAPSTKPSSSDAPSLRFNVNQVHLDPNEDNASDADDLTPRMNFPETTSPNRPLSTHESDTIGYATHDAVPMTVFYRNDNSHSNPAKKSRPTLQELRKGFEEDHEQQEEPQSVDNVENGGIGSDEIVIHAKKDKKAKVAPKFGWLKGVMLRCLLNIWGVMLYLRLTWVAGQAGIGWSTVIIVLSAVVTMFTTLSMSAVCTNGEVKGGGAYYLISRSLGPEFGGSIGLIFSVANAVAVALYVVGFAETVKDLIKENGGDVEVLGELNIIRIVGILTVILLLCVTLVGLEWVVRTQMFLLCILLVSIVDVIIGTFMGPQNDKSSARGFIGLDLNLFKENFGPAYREGENFFSVFAVFFPAATGILAGVNISGDLKDAQKGIPKGTLWAILISTIVYVLLDWLAAACVLRDASGVILAAAVNQTMNATSAPPHQCAADFSCEYGLMNDFQVMEKIAAWGPIVTGGIFAATLSSALASLVGAPKTFQALCKDNIFPGIHYFGTGVGPGDEPRRGYILTFLIAGAFIAIGELNVIAPVISNFFLMSYALINYAVFAASLGKSPGWRPSFKYYNMWVSLMGALVCIVIMFLINWWAALVTIVIIIALYKYVDYKKPEVNWGSSAQAYTYIRALRFTYRLNAVEEHVKNFRPQCLVLTGSPKSRPDLVHLVSHITRNRGLMVCGQVKIGPFGTVSGYEDSWLKQNKIRAFHTICSAPNFREGVRVMLQTVGLGKMKPNTVVLGYKRDWKKLLKSAKGRQDVEEYVNVVHDAFELDFGVAILRVRGEIDLNEWSVFEGEDWLAEEEEGEVLSDVDLSEKVDGEGVVSSESQSESNPRVFLVERLNSEDQIARPEENAKRQASFEEYQLEAIKAKPELGEDETSDEAKKLVTDRVDVKDAATSKGDEESPNVVKKGKFKVTVSKPPNEEEDESEDKVDETTKLTERVEPQKPVEVVQEDAFKEKPKGTIDVWWLFDDGGLTILIPYLLSIHSYWKDCKLRIFTPASTHALKSNELRMANLLKRFRIDFTSVVEVEGINVQPSSTSMHNFLKLPVKDEFPDIRTLEKDRKTMRNIRLGELIRQHSNDAKLIVITLPVPKVEMTSPLLYMSWLEVLSAASPPVLMVRGNQQSVLTFYS
ncbi:hypothetical protein ACROYT_G026717 [Oculina patagonica]